MANQRAIIPATLMRNVHLDHTVEVQHVLNRIIHEWGLKVLGEELAKAAEWQRDRSSSPSNVALWNRAMKFFKKFQKEVVANANT